MAQINPVVLIFHESKTSLNGCRGSSLSIHDFHPHHLEKGTWRDREWSNRLNIYNWVDANANNVVSYPLSSYPICCFSQGGDSSEACSVATATIQVMGLYWSCDWFATFSTLRVQGGICRGISLEMIFSWIWWWVGWDFCSINLNQPGHDNFNISLILTPTCTWGGTYRYPNGWMLYDDAVSTCQGFHPWLSTGGLGGFIPTVPSHIRFGRQMLALGQWDHCHECEPKPPNSPLARPWCAATASSSSEATPRRRKWPPGGDPTKKEGRIWMALDFWACWSVLGSSPCPQKAQRLLPVWFSLIRKVPYPVSTLAVLWHFPQHVGMSGYSGFSQK